MRILLTSHGSTGDIFPVIGLGRALVEAGHDVRFATVPFFREDVERAGIKFVSVPPDWDQSGFAEAMRDLTKAKNGLDLLRIIYTESLPFFSEIVDTLRRELETSDLFVCSYLFAQMATLAREQDVPAVVTTFAHNIVPSESNPPPGFPRMRFLPVPMKHLLNRIIWKVADRLVCWQINRVVGDELDNNGVDAVRGFILEPADLSLVTVSPQLFGGAKPLSGRFVFTGYLRWQAPEDEALEAELQAFCAGERVPVLTFGSVTFEKARRIMHRFMVNWPKGKKIVIQSGWAGLTIERPRPEMKVVGKVSHDQLFGHASVVIHHGGAGTTASVLHAGVPQIIIPHIGDQWFFAAEVERLGVGVELKRRRWPERLPTAVRRVSRNLRMSETASKVAGILASEDGPARAVAELEELVGSRSG